MDYLALRLWIGVWIGVILLLLVALDASAFVCYITRFTEENFALLIATIFIYKVRAHFRHPTCASISENRQRDVSPPLKMVACTSR